MSDDAAWDNFVAALDPAKVAAERYRVHGDLDAERPGSRQDHEVRFAHDYVRRDFWRRMRGELMDEEIAERRARAVDDADRTIHARGFDRIPDPDEQDIEAAIRSYSQRQAERAAQPRGHAA